MPNNNVATKMLENVRKCRIDAVPMPTTIVSFTKHRTTRTALKYGTASCGEEYTPGTDHVGFK